jgi:hypothetical protein
MDWKEIVIPLYEKIKPIGGTLSYGVASSNDLIKWISVGFHLENFKYLDPFYGEQEEKDKFEMYFNFYDVEKNFNFLKINEIENKEYKFSTVGAFSNSLDFLIPYCKFGTINDNNIEFTMKYILTNSDSYGMMSGDITEHSTIRGNLNVILEIKMYSLIQTSDGCTITILNTT